MEFTKVDGRNRGDVRLYALSTCGWCGKTKKLLENMGVEYSYVDIDLLGKEEEDAAMKEIERWNPRCSFPTLVINNERSIVGFKESEIKGTLG